MDEEKTEKENSKNQEEKGFVEVEGEKFQEDPENKGKILTNDEGNPIPYEEGTPKKPDLTSTELEEKNKRLYARMKKAEESEKLAKEELAKKKDNPSTDSTDVFNLAKTVSTLKEYNSEELDFIQMMSKAKSISPEEAAKTEEAKLYISARRQKVEADKSTPDPSTKQSLSKKPFDKITPEDVSNMTLKEKEEYFTKTGMMGKKRQFGNR